jgi:crotonobetainyl-CoA:carnitine CoA-transferase CaiB-like acyl-CoA transferase
MTQRPSGTRAVMSGKRQGPLAGITVLELGSLIAGPFCCRLLGDMGARVIKVEPPGTGDPLRNWGHVITESGSLWSLVQSRNKESVIADLRTEEGRQLVHRLVPAADVVIENFRAGRMEQWGLGPDDLRQHRDDLIVVRISAFGQTGPYRERPGFGSTAEALGGLRFLTGYPDGPPLRVGLSLADTVAALYAALGTCAALQRRNATGLGDVVDVALSDSVLSLLESVMPEYGFAGVVRRRDGNRLNGAAPSNTYLTRDGHWIAIGGNSDGIFVRLARLIPIEGLDIDIRFATNQSRREHVEELDKIIGAWVAGHDLIPLWELLNASSVPAAPVQDISQIVTDPQFNARDMICRVNVEGLGDILMPGLVPKFATGNGRIAWPGPQLGAHNTSVLTEMQQRPD